MREAGYRGIVIGATGNAQPEDIKDYLDHGADKVLVKPISAQAFKAAYGDCTKLS
jgi:CheY-like chemotaxis protein